MHEDQVRPLITILKLKISKFFYCKVFPIMLFVKVLVTHLRDELVDTAAAAACCVASIMDMSYRDGYSQLLTRSKKKD